MAFIRLPILVTVILTLAGKVAAQTTNSLSSNDWSLSASAYTYFVPEDQDYVQPTLTADHNRLHLEVRYNYEALHTGSAWIGWNFIVGDKLVLEITPIAGVVFGDTKGIAPGYKGSLSWRKIQLYSESEYVFDTSNSSDSFFYNWSELTFLPTDWFRLGFVMQRTQAYQSSRDIQRGFLLGFSNKNLNFSTYIFNPDDATPLVVIALGLDF